MTTDERIIRDIFDDPKWPLFSASAFAREKRSHPIVDSLQFTVSQNTVPESIGPLLAECLGTAHRKIKDRIEAIPDLRQFLFVGSNRWQPNTPLVKHKGLVGSMPKEIDLQSFRKETEIALASNNQLWFCGLFRVSSEVMPAALSMTLFYKPAFVIWSSRAEISPDQGLRSVVDTALSDPKGGYTSSINWARLVATFCPLGDIVFRVAGDVDERAVDVSIFASGDRFQALTGSNLLARP